MKTYSKFVQFYEDVFQFKEKTFSFLKSYFPRESNSVLDLGCGTGAYISKFSSLTNSVLGIDNDSEMIKYAKQKYPEAEFRQMDIMRINELENDYDLNYSIGNVISHIPRKKHFELAEKIYSKTNKNGRLIFQTVNWDRILDSGKQNFKIIENKEKGLQFFREYKEIGQDKVMFYLRLEENDKIIFEEEQTLFPISSEEYKSIYSSAGFFMEDHYGDYEKNPYSRLQSPANILIFRK